MDHHRDRELLGGAGDSGDLEGLRERVLDHPDEEEALTGADNENTSSASTGRISVKVIQDGIGRTGGIILAIFVGLAFGMSGMLVAWHGDLKQSVQLERSDSQRDRDRVLAQVTQNQLETAHLMERLSDDARLAERESRMLQYYLLELDAKVIKAGIKPASEAISKRIQESKP